ncbi:MAG: YkgJ family cysteine cluster protein [Gemmatimonadota bacterium]|nr:YkgJ family cysteine cluster protein [Gemmatimonadota bacterium]
MKPPFLQIEPSREPRRLPEPERRRLQAVYDQVPAVSCHCDRLGQCCELTNEEMEADFATMYPLYSVEYLNIVDYVQDHFEAGRRDAVLALTEERPARCPFLTDSGGCSIYPVRPLVCRTYGVLSREAVEEAARGARGKVSAQWVASFLFTERHTVCPHTRIVAPEALAAHAQNMVRFNYERELLKLGEDTERPEKARAAELTSVAGLKRVTRWTWGGYNVLMRSPLAWLKRNFAGYWRRSELAE